MWDNIDNATKTFIDNGTIVANVKTFGKTFTDADKPRVITDSFIFDKAENESIKTIRQQMVVRTDNSRVIIDAYFYEVVENRNTLCLLLIPKSDIGEIALEEYREMLKIDFRIVTHSSTGVKPEETKPDETTDEKVPELTGPDGTAPTTPETTNT
jgi:hypothetical protein